MGAFLNYNGLYKITQLKINPLIDSMFGNRVSCCNADVVL